VARDEISEPQSRDEIALRIDEADALRMRQMAAARRLVGLVCVCLAVLTMGLSSTTRANHKTVFAAYFENWISEDRGGFEVPTRFECSLPER